MGQRDMQALDPQLLDPGQDAAPDVELGAAVVATDHGGIHPCLLYTSRCV